MSKDPKAVKKTDRNASCPCTRDEILKFFEERGTEPHILLLVEHGTYANYPHLWNEVLNINLHSESSNNMWITPKGKIWACGFACHSRVAKLMGLFETNLEDAGWVKVSAGRAYGKCRPTAKQARIINDGDYRVSDYLMDNSMKATLRKPQEIWE